MTSLARRGFVVVPHFLNSSECGELLDAIDEFRQNHTLPLVHRRDRGRSLHYHVINGDQVAARLPAVLALYQRVNTTVNDLWGRALEPLADRAVGVNVNVTPPGGEYRWHYDRNAVTAVAYLNDVTGGEVEMYPNYRLYLGRRVGRAQQWLDRVLRWTPVMRMFGRLQSLKPSPGTLVVMRGDRCLHSVRAVADERDRVCVVMAYDVAGATFGQADALDRYLYRADGEEAGGDPNYAGAARRSRRRRARR